MSVSAQPPAFKDHFSDRSELYAHHRPVYPARLAAFLAARSPGLDTAVDCGCGSGQLTALLAEHFSVAIGVDGSASQIGQARSGAGMRYVVAPAEQTGLSENTADLVVAAQAAHWFDLPRFWREASRIARPGGLIAIVGYGVPRVDGAIDHALDVFHDVTLKPFWSEERWTVARGYRDLVLPFEEEPAPALDMTAEWGLDDFMGYLSTWSGVKAARRAMDDPLAALRGDLSPMWGAGPRTVRWPLFVRLCRKPPASLP
jgi:SAM-dependent methyltransferase